MRAFLTDEQLARRLRVIAQRLRALGDDADAEELDELVWLLEES